ncbi:MAG: hypothetical protein WCP87_01225 [Atribacterota bacterium]
MSAILPSTDYLGWKNRLEAQLLLRERIQVLEQYLQEIESGLNELLNIPEDSAMEEGAVDPFCPGYYELFSDLLATLREQEENTLKVPIERWKNIQTREVVDLDQMSINNLMMLYHYFLQKDDPEPSFSIDNQFKNLIEERKEFINRFFDQLVGDWFKMGDIFQDCDDRKATIATFLVLLDLVFRKILRMKEDQGLVFFQKNDGRQNDPVPD